MEYLEQERKRKLLYKYHPLTINIQNKYTTEYI